MNEILNVFRDGQPCEIDTNLDRFRPISSTLRGKRIKQVEILEALIYNILGWYSKKTLENRIARDVVYSNELTPLNITKTWRLGPGEGARLAQRLNSVLKVNAKCSRGWQGRGYYTNEQINEQPQTLNAALIKYKTLSSRNNYNSPLDIKFYSALLDLNNNNFWDWAIEAVVLEEQNPSHYCAEWIGTEVKKIFFIHYSHEQLTSNNFVNEDGDTIQLFRPHQITDNKRAFAANLIVLLKQALQGVRECPEITEFQEYPELTAYINEEIQHIEAANNVFENTKIVGSIILKNSQALYSMTKLEFKDLKARIVHPNENEKEAQIIPFVDLYNEPYYMNYYIIKSIKILKGIIRPYESLSIAYSSNNMPLFYNTAKINSPVAVLMDSFFNNDTINNRSIPPSNCCLSEYGNTIRVNGTQREYFSLISNVRTWATTYTCTRTTPYKHPKDLFFGLPKDIPYWYSILHDCSTESCANVLRFYNIGPERVRTTPLDSSKRGILNDSFMLKKLDYISDLDLQTLKDNKCSNCKLEGLCDLESYAMRVLNIHRSIEDTTIEDIIVDPEVNTEGSSETWECLQQGRLCVREESYCIHNESLEVICNDCNNWIIDNEVCEHGVINGIDNCDGCQSIEEEVDDQALALTEHQESRRREIMAEMTNWVGTI